MRAAARGYGLVTIVVLGVAGGSLGCGPAAGGAAARTAPAPAARTAPAPAARTAPAPAARTAPTPRAASAPAYAPTPFTAAEIRDATRPGRRWEWREERLRADGKPVVTTSVVEFFEVTPEAGRYRAVTLDEARRPLGRPRAFRARWEELRRHAEFPAAFTVVTEETVTVPAGTFPCRVYTVTRVRGRSRRVTRFYFARALPGPSVLFYTDEDGRRVLTSTLVRYRAGAEADVTR
jgi:hypothetical protein